MKIEPAVVEEKKVFPVDDPPPPPPVDEIFTCPLDSEVIVTLSHATRYDFPSDKCVREPDKFVTLRASVVLLNVKAESPPNDPPSLN